MEPRATGWSAAKAASASMQVQHELKDGKGDYPNQGQQALDGLAPDVPSPGQQTNGRRGKQEDMCINVPDVAQ